jgi:intein/homing endonuclease
MSLRALQDYTFVSKYARYNEELKRRETWGEAVNRVFEMHERRYPQVKEQLEWAKEQVIQKRVLGSQRALQFGGAPIEKKNARIFNCIASYCDRLRFFQESFWLLLCGCGVGFSVQKHHIAKLPDFTSVDTPYEEWPKKTFVIPDTIEGWSDSLGVLISSFMQHGLFPEYEGHNVIFDFSKIREEGKPLSSSSGKAPGPVPLRNALEKIRQLILRCIFVGERKRLRPIDAYDIVMHVSDAVLSGGVRRSATICLFSPDDLDMARAKTGNWFTENPQRGRSNNSALLVRGETSFEQFQELIGLVREFGEPGFVWADNTELIVNPCVTADTMVSTSDGLRSVTDLLGEKFYAMVEGESQMSSRKGFWLTGKKNVIRLEFASGRVLKLTPNHKLLTTCGWKEAGELEAEDEVIIHNHRPGFDEFSCIDDENKDYSRGYCLGNFLGGGNISDNKDGLLVLERAGWLDNHHKQHSESQSEYTIIQSKNLYEFAESKGCLIEGEKHLSKKALSGSLSYIAGIAAGYFDADGTVAVSHKKGCSLGYTSTSIENLRNLQIILNRFGIFSKIYQEKCPEGLRKLPDGNGGHKQYYCKATHELCVSCDSIQQFQRFIPIRNKEKISQIAEIVEGYKRHPNRTHFVDKVLNKVDEGMANVYDCTIPKTHAFDANGVYAHNCVEIGLYPVDIDTGLTGWEACNLCEINGKKCKTPEDFEIACKAAAIIGTVQAGYTDLAYLGPITRKILDREALLGISITGMMDNPDVLFDPKLQRENAKLILKVNEEISKLIGINPAARTTCVKPAGTTSCVLGTASGIHPHHAKRYIRRSQANWLEPPLQFFKSKNPRAVEKSVWSENGTDEVISFCVEVPTGAKTKNDIDAITLLEHVKNTQKNWVLPGTRKDRCVQSWLTHNVSNTIHVRDDEWESITQYIYDNRDYFCGISLLSITGDKDYPQAPFCAIYTPRELVQMYGDASVMASGLIVDALHVFEDNLWAACEAALGLGKPIEEPIDPETTEVPVYQKFLIETGKYKAKMDWIRRAKQFSERYFGGDVKKMTYCLKDVNNWKMWCDLKREYVDVDYTEMVEEGDNTKHIQESACAGGHCSVEYA